MYSFENITQRRKRTKSLSEISIEESSVNNFTLDGSTISLPNTSVNECDEIQNLKVRIEKLSLDLSAAHEEINQLSIENSTLKSTVSEVTIKYELLKKATKKLTSDIGSPNSKNKKSSTPLPKTTLQLKQKVTDEDRNLLIFKKNHQQSVSVNPDRRRSALDESQDMLSINTPQEIHLKMNNCRKLCIVTSNNVNKILDIAKNTFIGYKLCHYSIPNAGIKHLFTDLYKKLLNFTHEDYCIVYIGERDFEISNNYTLLIDYIKNELKNVTNTNIIICSPNFKLSNNFSIFNKRIEMFNHLMYMDIELCEYAYLFDSNYCLEYTNEMFWKYNARVNNTAVTWIFKNVMYFMSYLNVQAEVSGNFVSQQCFDNIAVGNNVNQSGNHITLHTNQATQTISTFNETKNDLFRL